MIGRLRSTLPASTTLGTRVVVRLVFAMVILLAVAVLVHGATTGVSTATEEAVPRADPRDGHTVVTESGRVGTIVAYRPNGSVLYYNNSRSKYFDVDPVPGEPLTVEYAASDTIHAAGPTCTDPPCVLNVIERADLETGEVDVVYARYDYREEAGEWHDHVRVDDEHVLIADIVDDQVFLVDTETELVEWRWDAQSAFPVEGGGPYPTDWAHVNDVELLDDGRVMVSLRNQDQVVFVDPATGLEAAWTLGAEDDYDVLFEQHNPDYIPEERGGPAVVVADSENGRVQEFQREGGEWVRTWEWSDERLQWPRDADRLANGNTLVVDTHGKRVLEVAPDGSVTWSVPSTLPYDAERLGPGVERDSGRSARALGLESRVDGGPDSDGRTVLGALSRLVETAMPNRIHNAIYYASPPWMERPEFAAAVVGLVAGLAWAGLELAWWVQSRGVGLRSPVYRRE